MKNKKLREEMNIRFQNQLDDPNYVEDNPDYIEATETLMVKLESDERDLTPVELELLEDEIENFETGALQTGISDGDKDVGSWQRQIRSLRGEYGIEHYPPVHW